MNAPAPSTAVDSVVAYLHSRGVLKEQAVRPVELVTPLTGGVSGETVLVRVGDRRVVVKRALARLLVQQEWLAKPERSVTEAAALQVLHRLTPEQTPELLDVDPERFTLVMGAADARWLPWKTRLMDADLDLEVEASVARTLGWVLGTWHRETAGSTELADRFDDVEAFEQLRVEPFHRTVARRHPEVGDAIGLCTRDLEQRRDCLVHGDFSPKNVLVSPGGADRDGLMVIDFEVAVYGAAVFDVAFLQSHLVLKAVHRPRLAGLFRAVADAMLLTYTEITGSRPGPHLGWHTACLLLARVDGLSTPGYLDEQAKEHVHGLALSLLAENDPGIDRVWDHALDVVSGGTR